MERASVCGVVENVRAPETQEQVYSRVYRHLVPDGVEPAVEVRFCRFAGVRSSIRLRHGTLTVRLSDLLESAPAPVLEALAYILVAKLAGQPVPSECRQRYRCYLNQRKIRRAVELARRTRGRKMLAPPNGAQHDLATIFDDLNRRYFSGKMVRPRLGWSLRPSRTTLGHYDPAHRAIVVSCVLDQPHVERLAVEYVLFHEMLHLEFPAEHNGARRRIHTKEFREAERGFPELAAAKRLLRSL